MPGVAAAATAVTVATPAEQVGAIGIGAMTEALTEALTEATTPGAAATTAATGAAIARDRLCKGEAAATAAAGVGSIRLALLHSSSAEPNVLSYAY